MAYQEKDIVHENGSAWVLRTKTGYKVFVIKGTHSVSDSEYSLTPDGLSIAVARADYIARAAALRYAGRTGYGSAK